MTAKLGISIRTYTCINNLKYLYSFIKKNMVDNLPFKVRNNSSVLAFVRTTDIDPKLPGIQKQFSENLLSVIKKCNTRGELLKI